MTRTLNIAGRLHTIADDGVLISSDELLDERKNKKQNVVNADVDSALADRYTKSEVYTKQEVNNLVSPNKNYVTVAEFTDLPISGATDTIYRVSSWDGSLSTPAVDVTKYSEYAWDDTGYVFLCVKTQIGEVYDISAANSGAKYADLSAALGVDGGNVPSEIRRGGMSVKFVQSSDNKYVQRRLMANEFTTDTTQWAIADEGVYVENPEFVYVKTDKEDKILWAIKADGDIYYGVGCPQQIKDYIEEKISSLSLDKYEDIVAFLSDYLGSDTTLKAMIDGINAQIATKLDAEGLDPEALATVQAVENSEWLSVATDRDDKILGGRKYDGTVVENVGIEAKNIQFNTGTGKSAEFDTLNINTQLNLSAEVRKNLQNSINASFSFINRPQKMVVASGTEKVSARSQFKMTTIKSFVPALDYKGNLVFENTNDPYDVTKKMLFEEHIVHTNLNYGGDWVHSVSNNDKTFIQYIQAPKRSIFGWRNQIMAIGGDLDGLILGCTTVEFNNEGKDILLWSLDGGRSFDPAISTYRAKITIYASELTDGTIVTIDNNTYAVITVSVAQTYLSSLTETTSETRRSAARAYLADKILLSTNTQDVLRTLACALIENGYKVRLKADSIDVYYKEIGDLGNNVQTISVGGNTKTFVGGISMTDETFISGCLLELGDTGINYIDGSPVMSKDLQEINTFTNINGSWHLIGYFCKNDLYDFTPTPLANIDLVIDDVDNLRTSTYAYHIIYNTIVSSSAYPEKKPLCEPIGFYNPAYKTNGVFLVGFRNQGAKQAYFCYSLDKGVTWSDIIALPSNANVEMDNLFIGLVRNPLLDNRGRPYFYDRANYTMFNRMFVALIAERRYSVVYAATAVESDDIENLQWSEFKPLNHFSPEDNLNHGGLETSLNIYSDDISGMSSSPGICYAPLHKGVAILYNGFQTFDGSKHCFKSLIAIEDC